MDATSVFNGQLVGLYEYNDRSLAGDIYNGSHDSILFMVPIPFDRMLDCHRMGHHVQECRHLKKVAAGKDSSSLCLRYEEVKTWNTPSGAPSGTHFGVR